MGDLRQLCYFSLQRNTRAIRNGKSGCRFSVLPSFVGGIGSLADAEFLLGDDCAVAVDVFADQIVEK